MKFYTENDSINYVCKYLENSGYADVHATQNEGPFAYYDIRCTHPLGYRYRIEVKRRNMESSKYNDTIIEKSKYNYFADSKQRGEIDGAWIATMFTDCWTVSNAFQPQSITKNEVPHTTEFVDTTPIRKMFLPYDFKKKYSYNTTI